MQVDLLYTCMYSNCLFVVDQHGHQEYLQTVGQNPDSPTLEDVLNVYQQRNLALHNKFTCTFNHCQMSEEHARSSMCCTIYQ